MRVNFLTAVAALNVVLAVALAWLWSDDSRRHWSEPAPLAPAIAENVADAPAEPAEVSRFRETLERPLFLASRRPGPKKDAAGEAQEAVELRDVKLLGTYGAGGKGGIIISRGGKVERVPVGASIGQWKVAGGEGRGAALERANGERRTIDLVLNTAAPPGATARPDAATAATAGSAAARPAPARSAGNDGGPSREVIRNQRLERLNARRSQAGLPPLPE